MTRMCVGDVTSPAGQWQRARRGRAAAPLAGAGAMEGGLRPRSPALVASLTSHPPLKFFVTTLLTRDRRENSAALYFVIELSLSFDFDASNGSVRYRYTLYSLNSVKNLSRANIIRNRHNLISGPLIRLLRRSDLLHVKTGRKIIREGFNPCGN